MKAEIINKVWGRAKGMVQDVNTNEIVYESPWTNNLILNNGLNFCLDNDASDAYNQSFLGGWPIGSTVNNSTDSTTFFAYGTGSAPNSYSSTICATPVSASQTDNIITLTNSFGYLNVFDVLKYNDGTSTFITSANPSSYQYVSRKNLTKTSQHFTVYNTSRHTLQQQVSTSNTLHQAVADNKIINADTGVISLTCTRQFPEVTGATQYITEVGACTGRADTTAMASRLTFDAAVPVSSGQRFVLTYNFFNEIPLLSASNIGYTATSGVNANITGWPTASGQFSFYHIVTGAGSGADFMPSPQYNLGHAKYPKISLYNDNRSFIMTKTSSTFTAPTGLITNTNWELITKGNTVVNSRVYGPNPYTSNAFSRNYTIVYDPTNSNDFNSSEIGCIVWNENVNSNYSALRFNFETLQTKLSTQRLTITLTTSVDRDI